MTWSLAIANGDLDVSGASLGVTRGANKLVQDFRCALLEELGNDDMQPKWGSILDGGVGVDGTVYSGVIGEGDVRLAATMIEGEVRRIGAYLQTRQLNRLKRERLTYNKVTLTASEMLVGITSVRILQTADELTVLVTLQTGDNQLLDLAVPVTDSVAT
jgi:hypothetical protein